MLFRSVDDVEAVFNYDLPQDEEYYVHRIGRTGRAGRSGIAFTFVAGKAMRKLRDIERYTKTKIKRAEIPSANDVEEFKANTFLEKVKNTIEEGHLGKYIDYIENLLDEDFATIDIASALLKMALGEEKKEEVIEMQEEIGETGAEPGMVRLFINIGRNHKIQARDVIGAIAGETGIPGKVIEIGRAHV